MPYDPAALGAACGGPPAAHELCRADLAQFRAALSPQRGVLVTCTQEAPTFREAAGAAGEQKFVNIREAAGWSDEAAEALPKVAALVAAALVSAPPAPSLTQHADGIILIYGRDEAALEAAERLRHQLDVTVLLTGDPALTPPPGADYPVVRGTVRQASGHLGAFDLTIDGFAPAIPSSRRVLEFFPPRDGARSQCDIILDLSGGTKLFSARRDGYLRPDPRDPIAVHASLLAAVGFTGTFDKPRYVAPDAARCAHARNGRTGCTRCLDACPAGAISPAGNAVAVDPHICSGCGSCVAACPAEAMLWSAPDAKTTVNRLRALLTTYRDRGGEAPVLVLHDHAAMLEMLARVGDGLPARVLPLAEPRVLGLEALAAGFAFGAADIRVLLGSRAADRDAWQREIELVSALLDGLGYGSGRIELIETDDPFLLRAALDALPVRPGPRPARFLAMGGKREITRQALNALRDAAPVPADAVALPEGAPLGRVVVAEGCTLCLSCVSVCPTAALRDGQDRPALSFIEDACVQCGLCVATCPEHVMTLEPRATFGPSRRDAVLLRQEEPALCTGCGKPFGVKSSIDRVAAQLVGKHWMFSDPSVIARLRLCADCRVVAQTRQGLDPYAGPPRPKTRTADDP